MRRSRCLTLLTSLLILAAAPLAAPPTAFAQSEGARLSERLSTLWSKLSGKKLPAHVALANGRIEAEQVLVSAKYGGRISTMLVQEGQTVEAGASVARMDTAELDAQRSGAEAQIRRAENAGIAAQAAIAQRKSELLLAQQEHQRAAELNAKGFGTNQQLDLRRSQLHAAEAALRAANASLDESIAATDAARADLARIRAQLADADLKAPRRGRVEYKLVQSGEVVAAGAPVASLLDLSDIYMTVFLPARVAGRLGIGDEARLQLDPAPEYMLPASVSFVAAEAQFTPKTVETADEREKLMFRVKLRIAPQILKQYETQVKTGIRGVGYVRSDSSQPWPAELAVKLPQ